MARRFTDRDFTAGPSTQGRRSRACSPLPPPRAATALTIPRRHTYLAVGGETEPPIGLLARDSTAMVTSLPGHYHALAT